MLNCINFLLAIRGELAESTAGNEDDTDSTEVPDDRGKKIFITK